jgi:cytidine deaminase
MVEYENLVKKAIESLKKAHKHQPENLKYGSAVLTKKGNIYSACNYWSYTASLTLHAEQAALAHAAAHGETEIIAIACVGTEDDKKEKYCHPCGMCKQLIYENSKDSGIDIEVIMGNLRGEYINKKISEIISYPWP